MKRCNLKKGFTLAEVLITLGIIAVVAAMTMPSLIANYQKKVISARLKKFVSSFSQAYNMAIAKYGDSTYWEYCNIKSGNSTCSERDGIASQNIISSLNAIEYSNNLTEAYKQTVYNGALKVNAGASSWSVMKCWQLSDGALLYAMIDRNLGNEKYLTSFHVDVNGMSGPNKYGKDIFTFAQIHTNVKCSSNCQADSFSYNMDLNRGLYMNGYGYFKDEPIDGVNGPIKSCKSLSSTIFLKYTCAYLIQENGWEFPDYYPWGAF